MKHTGDLRIATLLCILVLALLFSACSDVPSTPPPTSTVVPTETATPDSEEVPTTDGLASSGVSVQGLATNVAGLATAVAQRTPIPTPTRGFIDQVVVDAVKQRVQSEASFLGLKTEDWIDLVVSALILVLSLLLILPLLSKLITWLVQRTRTRFDDDFFEAIRRHLFWLVSIVIVRNAILHLDFLGAWLETTVQDVAYVLIMIVLVMIAFRLINFTSEWALENWLKEVASRKRTRPVVAFLRWLLYLFVLMLAVTALTAHFGVNSTLLIPSSLFILLIVAIIGAAAQAALADTISGILILTDEPFRIGDTIYITKLDKAGVVVSIGLRTTRIHNADNQRITVPNSVLGESEVINYSLPDPRHRTQIDFVAVGESFDHLKQLIEKTVLGTEGVLQDKPVNVIYLSFGGAGREIRVSWWVESVSSQFRVQTKVLVALEKALDEAGIETPNVTFDLNVQQTQSPLDASENNHLP